MDQLFVKSGITIRKNEKCCMVNLVLRMLSVGLVLIALAFRSGAQELPVDTLLTPDQRVPEVVMPMESVVELEEETAVEEVHSARKAAIYSAILPGLGQAYNRKYWKIPLVYGGFAAFGYFIRMNHESYNIRKNAYLDLSDNNPETTSYMNLPQIIYYNLDNPSEVANLKQGLLRSQDYFRRNRDLLVILSAAFYGLNIIDASVDAHFFNWDISDDLTLNMQPSVWQHHQQNIYSLNCTIRF